MSVPQASSARAGAGARPRVVIVGCGFGGLEAAKALAKADVEIIVIDRTNHHLFQPLLYQVATAGLPAPAIAAPIRHVLRQQISRGQLTVLMGEVTSIDTSTSCVVIDGREHVHYDQLIVAAGATHSYFGRDDWAKYAPGLKTLGDAFTIRRRVLTAFEQAEREHDPAKREPWLTFAVVGAGPTGVEMAGTMAEIAQHTLSDEFRHIDPARARVLLAEGAPQVLPAYPPPLALRARQALERLGVEVRTGTLVVDVQPGRVSLRRGTEPPESLPTHTVIWAAGVRASRLGQVLAERAGATLDRSGQVEVTPTLTLPGHHEVFVLGVGRGFRRRNEREAKWRKAFRERIGALRRCVAPPAQTVGRVKR